jgi:hypothetical protein
MCHDKNNAVNTAIQTLRKREDGMTGEIWIVTGNLYWTFSDTEEIEPVTMLGASLGISPKLGTSLARIYLLAVACISLAPCAISSIQLCPCP